MSYDPLFALLDHGAGLARQLGVKAIRAADTKASLR